MSRPDLTGVPGVPETDLGAALLAGLPTAAPPPPWTVTGDAVLWLGGAAPGARLALPGPLRRDHPQGVVGGFVRYRDTPVGPYDEVLGVVGWTERLRPRGAVCFMAVDDEAGLVGGRRGWGLPKTAARFEGDPLAGAVSAVAADVDGPHWQVRATTWSPGPWLPLRARTRVRQVLADGTVADSRLRARGRARPALVTVRVESQGPLSGWLRTGWHPGVVLRDVTLVLAEPVPR